MFATSQPFEIKAFGSPYPTTASSSSPSATGSGSGSTPSPTAGQGQSTTNGATGLKASLSGVLAAAAAVVGFALA